MKTFYLSDLKELPSDIEISGEQHHHFCHVLRGQAGEKVALKDGKGSTFMAEVTSVSKKKLMVQVESRKTSEQVLNRELAIGIPKKDYLFDILRSCTEIGVKRVHLVTVDYTPWKFKPSERQDKVMVSALIQSGADYLPEIVCHQSLEGFLKASCDQTIIGFSTESEEFQDDVRAARGIPLIGPEGGFSDEEVELLRNSDHVRLRRLPTPIMKAITAVPYCLGFTAT